MSLPNQLKTLLGLRRQRRTAEAGAWVVFLETSRPVRVLIFLCTIAAIVAISSVELSTAQLPVLPNQLATARITATLPFSYDSALRTAAAREQLRDRVPPVYRLETGPLEKFERALRELEDQVTEAERPAVPASSPDQAGPLAEPTTALEAFNSSGPYHVSVDDFRALFSQIPPERRAVLLESGLAVLRQIYADGVHDGSLAGNIPGQLAVTEIKHRDGTIGLRRVQSLEEALAFLRLNLADDDTPRPVSAALFRILRQGVAPNLVYDRSASEAREQAALRDLPPVKVDVAAGQTIIEPGLRVTAEQYEMLMAHRQALRDNAEVRREDGLRLFGRVLLVLAMVLASMFYIRLEDRATVQSNGRLGLLALVVILNLALVRAVFSLSGSGFFATNGDWASTLPYIAPSAFAPLIVAILIDAGSAIFMALFISIFTGVIYGNRLDLIVVTFLASVVAIFCCQDVRRRGRVVRAAGFGGFTIAAFALLVGIADQLPGPTLTMQFGAGLASGVLTGILVVGLLPVLESLFKRTTNITLLELTDYNHPLLRRMQLEAPGTYHHSLVVAQLAENAADAIGANPLLARVCALFHDIGKTVKPEYFIENQRDRANPHDESNPSLSALVIKSHVKEGVDLARKHRLPRPVVDVIQQHHGTSLIRYFFHREVKRTRTSTAPFQRDDSRASLPPGLAPAEISETTYRYDGPRPSFRESAIISLADGIEAASRSLRRITPPHVAELIDAIIKDRIDDHQLDDSPLTFAELRKVKTSFAHTMLNMLHARIDYPTDNTGTQPTQT